MGLPILKCNDHGHCNFVAEVRKDGVLRFRIAGHNVSTAYAGYGWLRQLMSDLAKGHRVRWIGLGTGWAPEVPEVKFLANPTEVSAGTYLAELDPSLMENPVPTAVKIHHSFSGADIAPGGSIDIAELGLYAGFKDSGGVYHPEWEPGTRMDPGSQTNPVVAYKSFVVPITVLSSETLSVIWELRF